MRNSQEHIINRVVIDVDTTSEKVAYGLKDNLDVFLKEEIFPYLEQYFDTLEKEFPSQIIQIPKLTLNVVGNDENNFENIKEVIKQQTKQELQRIMNSSKGKKGDVVFLSTDQSKQDAFFYFLEKGIAPWWKKTGDHLSFNEEDLIEIAKMESFKNRFNIKIQTTSITNRLINQFSDVEMEGLFRNVFKDDPIKIDVINSEVIEKMKHLSPLERKQIWKSLIRYLLVGNSRRLESVLIEMLAKKELRQTQRKKKGALEETVTTILKGINGKSIERLYETLKTSEKDELSEAEKRVKEKEGKTENDSDEKFKDITSDKAEKLDLRLRKSQTKNELLKYDEANKYDDCETNKKKGVDEEKYQKSSKSNENETIEENVIDNENLELKEENDLTEETLQYGGLKKQEVEDVGEYHIENAGLIILHPYLKDFFKACDLLDENNDIPNPELAIHLLHYLATKKEQQFESNMVFEKFLCGIAIEQSIRREVVIPEGLKQKAEDLLKSVAHNWSALNDASTDLLRNEFLQRSGKLSFKAENPKITIERKVHDILLDRLPWALGLCKLPWVDKLIFTDW